MILWASGFCQVADRFKVVRFEVLMAVTQDYWMLEYDAP
jgi:hypothetical protein